MSALQLYANEIEDLFGIRCWFRCDEQVLIHDTSMATHLYHIAQEAVNNAIKHGHAGSIGILLYAGESQGTLIVRDDGVGIAKPLGPHTGVGMHIMNYRAGMIGGTLEIRREQPNGTVVTCRFPVGPKPDTAAWTTTARSQTFFKTKRLFIPARVAERFTLAIEQSGTTPTSPFRFTP